MRALVNDEKLIGLLNEIESYLGPISLATMPIEHRHLSRCSISFIPEHGWILWHIPEKITSQATICHELAHLILLIEGYPAFIIDSPIPNTDYLFQTTSMLKNLVLHIEVWKIVKLLGFDEIPDYKPGLEYLISQVQNSNLLIDARPNEIIQFRAAYLAQGLLNPAESETIALLRETASQTMPEELELADSIIRIFDNLSPLSPKSCAEALSEICALLKIHRGMLIASWPDRPVPDFRSRIIN
ncbi:TPA: hypothetical protein PXL76_004299 [Yersinia enterocolitica]|nr:hypothetical protein [Yersinia enterocolitica]HDL6892766.1 hypothetical protein [Yersinia enterocolitica]